MNLQAKWITHPTHRPHEAIGFQKTFSLAKAVTKATLYATSLGVYEAFLNGERIGDFVLAPGWTVYEERIQVQAYDVTSLLGPENELKATVAPGWYASPLGWARKENDPVFLKRKAFLCELHLTYEDGTEEILCSDPSWKVSDSRIRFSEIYDGEVYDASFEEKFDCPAEVLDHPTKILIPQEGEYITEQERVAAQRIFKTPKGETVVDFGQEVTGYVEFSVTAHQGDMVHLLHGEVLDKDGNFYNANYRTAKAEITYLCKEGFQTYHPHLTFFGFRYILLDKWPEEKMPDPSQFTAIEVHSAIKKTGHVTSSSPLLNQLFSNVFWSQKDNFLDVPTDCPQRDERLGWTGDAQAFIKTASYNYNVDRFFTKWLHDMKLDQMPDGGIPHVIPNILYPKDFSSEAPLSDSSAAWADAATICPWQLYMTYGNTAILEDLYETMIGWIRYIQKASRDPFLWTGGKHYGDWLGLDAPQGTYKGSTREDFIASAFYANSVNILCQAGKVLGKDTSEFEALYHNIVTTFRKTFPTYKTQTEHVLAIHFNLAEDPQKTADALAAMIQKDGSMKTGFVGTPYLLHVLSDYGYGDLSYQLLLREEYPSWLYSVKKGATTTWEHWDSIMEDGSFWSTDMNSFNHYAYGSVLDWVYEKALGIQPMEPGFKKVRIAPTKTGRLAFMEASLDTAYGTISSKWQNTAKGTRFDITLPVEGEFVLDGKTISLAPGSYVFWG